MYLSNVSCFTVFTFCIHKTILLLNLLIIHKLKPLIQFDFFKSILTLVTIA